jgi:3-keto-5-aminohexanoate cleavage enzyme
MDNISWKFTDNREWRDHYRNWPPVIISCAITGGLQGKEANPNLPTSPEEQADSAYEAYKAGASSIHIHARDPRTDYNTAFTATAEDFYKVNHLIRERCPDVIICDTGSTTFTLPEEEIMQFYKIMNPELSSLDVGTMYMLMNMKVAPETVEQRMESYQKRGAEVSYNAETGRLRVENSVTIGYTRCERVARAMKAVNCKPEFEVFNSASWWFVDHVIQQGLAEPPYWCQLVFGQEGACSLPTVKTSLQMIDDMPPNSMFSAIGIGPLQLSINTLSLIMGGHIRVGMEDNVYYKRGELAVSNAQFVERAVRLCHELNREVATPAQARQMLGISSEPKQYPL